MYVCNLSRSHSYCAVLCRGGCDVCDARKRQASEPAVEPHDVTKEAFLLVATVNALGGKTGLVSSTRFSPLCAQ